MIRIVVDLEMNKVSGEYKEQRMVCNSEIIEFGAVAVDDLGQKISEYKAYVCPELNDKIEKKIEKLTKISYDMVATAGCFEQEMDKFVKWCESFDDELVFYEWSDSDYLQISNEIRMKEINVEERWGSVLKSSWRDFQREYCNLLGLERIISLKQAIDYAGFDFNGRQHDALFDADNTAELLILSMDSEKFDHHMKAVLDALNPKEEEFKLGDLFNFSGMVLAS